MGANSPLDQMTTLLHFAAQPACVTVRGQEDERAQEISLKSLVERRCSSLFIDYRPIWWLFNGHLQTMYNSIGDFSKMDRLLYRRHMLRLADGGTLGLDFAPADSARLPEGTPIIVVQHGLTGGAFEHYVRSILVRACTSVKNGGLGYRAVVVTFRGCAGTPLTTPRLYTAGHTDDLRQALTFIANKYPRAPLLGVGFSMGANIMARYVAEEGNRSRLSSAVVLSCPWDMEKNGHSLVSTFLGKNLWSRGMGTNLLNLVKRHEKAFCADPDHPVAKILPSVLALSHPTMDAFDQAFTSNIGDMVSPFPFPDVWAYYRWASSEQVLKDIEIPFLAINAADDPVVTLLPANGSGNPKVVMAVTRAGGHIGWFQSGENGPERWTTKPVLEWLALMGREVIHAEVEVAPIYVDEQGFIRESGRPNLGCKEVEGGGVVDGFRLI